jgi:hypothetical protein
MRPPEVFSSNGDGSISGTSRWADRGEQDRARRWRGRGCWQPPADIYCVAQVRGRSLWCLGPRGGWGAMGGWHQASWQPVQRAVIRCFGARRTSGAAFADRRTLQAYGHRRLSKARKKGTGWSLNWQKPPRPACLPERSGSIGYCGPRCDEPHRTRLLCQRKQRLSDLFCSWHTLVPGTTAPLECTLQSSIDHALLLCQEALSQIG